MLQIKLQMMMFILNIKLVQLSIFKIYVYILIKNAEKALTWKLARFNRNIYQSK